MRNRLWQEKNVKEKEIKPGEEKKFKGNRREG